MTQKPSMSDRRDRNVEDETSEEKIYSISEIESTKMKTSFPKTWIYSPFFAKNRVWF